MKTKQELFENGKDLMRSFCIANKLEVPNIIRMTEYGRYYHLACGFYRHSDRLRPELHMDKKKLKLLTGTDDQVKEGGNIFIGIKACAKIGTGGRAWSYPGHWIDRTPYGVIQHELGHYVDECRSNKQFHFAYSLIHGKLDNRNYNIQPITGYCPGKSGDHQWCSEWFAEYFRLFVTNPDLLQKIRPHVYEVFIGEDLKPVEIRSWAEVLEEAPERTYQLVQKKIKELL